MLDAAARSDDVSSSVTTASVCVVSEDAVAVAAEVGPPLTWMSYVECYEVSGIISVYDASHMRSVESTRQSSDSIINAARTYLSSPRC